MKINYIAKTGVIGIVLTLLMINAGMANAFFNVEVSSNANPWTHLKANNQPGNFQFVVVPDRTGGMRPGVFEDAVRKINLLQPEFVISVGDLIEGYNEDHMTYEEQWNEFDNLVNQLQMPFFYVCGNHDITNNKLLNTWKRRLGRPYYHFVYNDVLFMILDSEDPPDPPPGARKTSVSPEQVKYFREALKKNKNVRWTFLFFHRPMWMDAHNTKGFDEIEKLLQDRPYTVFTGHHHCYQHDRRFDRDYYVLATAGGVSGLRGVFAGQMDHVVLVTMRNDEPVVANILLDGIGGSDIRDKAIEQFKTKVFRPNQVIDFDVIMTESNLLKSITIPLIFVNHTKLSMQIQAAFEPMQGIVADPSTFDLRLSSEKCRVIEVALNVKQPLIVENIQPLQIIGKVKYFVGGEFSPRFDLPFTQSIIVTQKFHQKTWNFEKITEGWGKPNQCVLSVEDGKLIVESNGADPFFQVPLQISALSGDWLEIIIRAKSTSSGNGQFFWGTEAAPAFNGMRSVSFSQTHDGQWHDYKVKISPLGILNSLRFDPSTGDGLYEIDFIKIIRRSH